MLRRKRSFHYQELHKKWVLRHKALSQKLWSKHKEALSSITDTSRQLAAGSLSGILLLAAPAVPALSPPNVSTFEERGLSEQEKTNKLLQDLSYVVPKQVRVLNSPEEQQISEILSKHFGLSVKAELEGKRLNRTYGLIGAEQHLSRYPGDSLYTHFETPEEQVLYARSGMAPGLGAWRYFASSKAELIQKDILREKYYIAVQTFESPNFYQNVSSYRDFYKFRKILLVNPENGKALIADIGDAGPAVWTGKHLGGSPEVMGYLERVDGAQKGPVLYFFIEDPNDEVPLGPIHVQ